MSTLHALAVNSETWGRSSHADLFGASQRDRPPPVPPRAITPVQSPCSSPKTMR